MLEYCTVADFDILNFTILRLWLYFEKCTIVVIKKK